MKKYLSVSLFLLILVLGCEKHEPFEKIFLITENQKISTNRAFDGCVIRYSLGNYFSKLSETLQKQSIDKAFAVWQKTNPNVLFINVSDTTKTELTVRFVNSSQISKGDNYAPVGLIKTPLKAISLLRQVKGFRYEILLDNTQPWDEQSLIRVLTYHIGNYLGFGISTDVNSVMYPYASNISVNLSKSDSIQYNQLYSLPCKDFKYETLPIQIKLSNLVTKDIKLERAGIVTIKSTGVMVAGTFIGDVTPDGKFEFTIGGVAFDISAQYDINPDFPHGAVIYKINDDKDWRLCKSNCEFSTLGNEYITLQLFINDSNAADNTGTYTTIIDYK
jgi:hypothetical protein